MIASKGCERLYLQRDGSETVYIDLPVSLPQHQIDGIRFLYRQQKKKAPGVILNDPPGYGKCLQATLFLSALLPVLKKPVLILSDSVANWKEQFEVWTEYGNEIIIECSNPFTKQRIKINPVKDGFLLSRRSWGIVVVHDERTTHEFLSLNFNADFKIWITRYDLKENLYTLVSIYEWLHPNQKFNVDNFTADRNNKRDIIEKAVLLDAFLEDFLIRRTDFNSPFKKPECHQPVATVTPSPTKGTRKNKDPTGFKVKRSKKIRIEDDDNETNDNIVPIRDMIVTNKTNIDKDNRSNDNNMDVEDFIRDEEPINCEEFAFLRDRSIAKSRKNKDPTGTKVKKTKTIIDNNDGNISNENIRTEVFNSTTYENVGKQQLNENIIAKRSISGAMSLIPKGFKIRDPSSLTDTVNSPHSSDIKLGDNTLHENFYSGNNSKDDANVDSSLVLRYTETEVLVENTTELSKIEKVKEITFMVPETADSDSYDKVTVQKDSQVQEIGVHIPETELSENSTNGFDINKFIKEEKPSVTNDKNIDNISNSKQNSKIYDDVDNSIANKVDDLDAKLAEMEAKALQRLKNSILDSLF